MSLLDLLSQYHSDVHLDRVIHFILSHKDIRDTVAKALVSQMCMLLFSF